MKKQLKALFTAISTIYLLIAIEAKAATKIDSPKSEITDYNYVCTHTHQPDALVFKTSVPQKAWRTILQKNGEIKKGTAFELKKFTVNAAAINIEGKAASFKAELAKNYEIKGLFQKQTDNDIHLTVITNYTIDKNQRKETYNCLQEKSDTKPILLGSTE